MTKSQEIMKLIKEGKNNTEIMTEVECSKQLISNVRRKVKEDDGVKDTPLKEVNEVKQESELRDYTEIHINEMGFVKEKLYSENKDNQYGCEYFTPIGRIDLLLTDKNENLYVIEFKKSKESDKVVGQILRYMGYLRKNLAKANVFGFIVVSEITDKLKYAAAEIPNILLFEYNLNITINRFSDDPIKGNPKRLLPINSSIIQTCNNKEINCLGKLTNGDE